MSAQSCLVCQQGSAVLDWKKPESLKPFLNARGGVKNKNQSGLCNTHHAFMKKQVDRARKIALLPYPTS